MVLAGRRLAAVLVLLLAAGCGVSDASPTPVGSGAAPQSVAPGPTRLQTAGPVPPPPTTGPVATPSSDGSSAPEQVAVDVEPFAQGMDALTFVTHAGDGTGLLYAVEQRGVIRVLEADGSVLPEPFVDLTDRITAGGERGLLGLAFHPDHSANGRFFVDYTDKKGDTVVSELRRSGETSADAGSERVLLRVDQPFANHNGGMIAFGPDGFLYIGLGDGGSGGDPQGNGQNRSTLLGKILRIDVDVDTGSDQPYAIPADNPFADGAEGRPEIWAWGLRNPWRFSFDRTSGALFIGDVGQGAAEEIDVQLPTDGGLNFGWNTMEGPGCYRSTECDQSGLTLPVASYGRGGAECAVTGGYVYRGQSFGLLSGTYLFADYCSGRVWGMDAARAVSETNVPFEQLGSVDFRVSSFGEDQAGELYLIDHEGAIARITARPR